MAAALIGTWELMPLAIAGMVWIEQGAITRASVGKEPLASRAGNILVEIPEIREPPYIRGQSAGFKEQHLLSRARHDQVNSAVRCLIPQPFQQTQAVNRAARARVSPRSASHLSAGPCSEYRTKTHQIA